jgi:hypothetical protein
VRAIDLPPSRDLRRLRRIATVSCAFGLFAATPDARADEPAREIKHDPTAFPAPDTRLPLVAVGFATTAVWYGAALAGSYIYPTANGAEELRIPVAGPWMSLFETGCPSTTPDCSTFWMVVGAVFKGLSGVGQAGGIFIMLEGLFLPTLAPQKAAVLAPPADAARRSTAARFTVVPTPLPSGAGVGVIGNF